MPRGAPVTATSRRPQFGTARGKWAEFPRIGDPAIHERRAVTGTELRPDATEVLAATLRERIMVLDGAMGTAIQQERPDEAGYRGERFADWPTDLQGNNDLLTLTTRSRRPDPPQLPRRRCRHHRDEHVQRQRHLPRRLPDERARPRAEPRGRRAGRHEADAMTARTPTGRAGWPVPSGRPRARPRSRRTSTTPARATSPSTSSSRPMRILPAASSRAEPTSCSSRRSSTRSTPRPRSSPSRGPSRTSAVAGRSSSPARSRTPRGGPCPGR